jgi:hypothetical protein
MYDEYLEYPLQYQARSALSWLYIIIVNLKRILPRWLKSHVKHDSYSEHERLWILKPSRCLDEQDEIFTPSCRTAYLRFKKTILHVIHRNSWCLLGIMALNPAFNRLMCHLFASVCYASSRSLTLLFSSRPVAIRQRPKGLLIYSSLSRL